MTSTLGPLDSTQTHRKGMLSAIAAAAITSLSVMLAPLAQADTIHSTIDWLENPGDSELTPNGDELWVVRGDADDYISNSSDYTVSIADTANGADIATIDGLTVSNSSKIKFSPDGVQAYIIEPSWATVVSVDNREVEHVIEFPRTPFSFWGSDVVFSPDGRKAFFSDRTTSNVLVIDTVTFEVSSRFDIDPTGRGMNQYGVALSPGGETLYLAGADGVDVIDAENGTVSATIGYQPGFTRAPDNHFAAYDLVLSPGGEFVYVAGIFNTTSMVGPRLLKMSTESNTIVDSMNEFTYFSTIDLEMSLDGSRIYGYEVNGREPFTVTTADMQRHPSVSLPKPNRVDPHIGRLTVSADGARGYISTGQPSIGGPTLPMYVIDYDEIDTDDPGQPDAYRPGQTLNVMVTGLQPLTVYTTKWESTPFCVNEDATSDRRGTLQVECTLPSDLASGTHHFNVYKKDGTRAASLEFEVSKTGERTDTNLSVAADESGSTDDPDTSPGSLGSLFGS